MSRLLRWVTIWGDEQEYRREHVDPEYAGSWLPRMHDRPTSLDNVDTKFLGELFSPEPDTLSKDVGFADCSSDVELESDADILAKLDLRGLRFAPPEVREMIFFYVLEGESTDLPTPYSQVPTLLKALIGDKELFHEALAVYYKNRHFKCQWARDDSALMGDNSSSALGRVCHLEVICRELSGQWSLLSQLLPSPSILRILREAINVEGLYLIFPMQFILRHQNDGIGYYIGQNEEIVVNKAVKCIESFKKLKELFIWIAKDAGWRYGPDSADCAPGEWEGDFEGYRPYPAPLDHVTSCLGSRERMYFVGRNNNDLPTFEKYWGADGGKVFAWNELPLDRSYINKDGGMLVMAPHPLPRR